MRFIDFIILHQILNSCQVLSYNLTNYDKYQPPPTFHTNRTISVSVRLHSLFLSMPIQDPEEALTIEGHFNFKWVDERLAKYPFINFRFDEIWSGVPSVAHIAGSKTLELALGEDKKSSAVAFGPGIVIGDGVLRFRAVKACRSDLTDWPYDTKLCNIHFIGPKVSGARVQYEASLYFLSGKRIMGGNSRCNGWDILNLDFLPKKNGSQIELSFVLKRNSARYSPYYHLPAIANLLVSLSLFFLEPQSRERFVLLLLVTIIQFYFLLTLSLLAPHRHYFHRPKIEYFIEMTAIIILIQIFLVIFCVAISVTEYQPLHLSKIVSMIVMSRALKTFFLLDVDPKETNELIGEEEEEGSFLMKSRNRTRKQWQLVSNLVDRATFYVLLLMSSYLICLVI